MDGFHPAALGGLLRYYGRDISGKNVIIQFNPLWMTSAKHDLQIQKEFHFNHPKLVGVSANPGIANYPGELA